MLDTDKSRSELVVGIRQASGTDASSEALLDDEQLWARLRAAVEVEAYVAAWLALQCRIIDGICQAVVVLGKPDRGPFIPVANWPEQMRGSPGLSAATERALAERRATIEQRKFGGGTFYERRPGGGSSGNDTLIGSNQYGSEVKRIFLAA